MSKVLGVTVLDLDKKRKYQLNLNAMINFEEATGKKLMEMQEDEGFDLVDIRALLWAGLNEFDDITLEEAGGLIYPGNMEKVASQIMGAYESAMPDEAKDEGEPEGKNKSRPAG